MNRRDLLTALGAAGVAGLGGCLETVVPTVTDETPYPPGKQRRITLHDADTVAEQHDVTVEVDVLQSVITHQQTAHIRISTTNTGHPRFLSVGRCLFECPKRSDSPPGLCLHYPSDDDSFTRQANKWVRDKPADHVTGCPATACTGTVLDSGERVQTEYTVWDDYRVAGYFEPGTYRWETTVPIAETDTTDDVPDMGDPLATIDWGFSLTVQPIETPP